MMFMCDMIDSNERDIVAEEIEQCRGNWERSVATAALFAAQAMDRTQNVLKSNHFSLYNQNSDLANRLRATKPVPMLSLLARRALASGAVRQASCSIPTSLKQFVSSATAWSGATATPVPTDEEGRAVSHGTTLTALLLSVHSPHCAPFNSQTINKMLYRSRQRGWLELDLLIVSCWALALLACH